MASLNKNAAIVVTIPEELKDSSKQVKFIYLALRNMIYAQKVNSYGKVDLEQFAYSIITAFNLACDTYKINPFKSDKEKEGLFNLLCSYDRTIMNRNESIVVMHKLIKPVGRMSKEQLLALFCHFMLECTLQVKNDTLSPVDLGAVYDELMKKMLFKNDQRMRELFISEIIDTFKLL